MELLQKIGKKFFVDHYYDFKNNRIIVSDMTEDYTKASKRTRLSKSRRIFREGKQIEALEEIIHSKKMDLLTINAAKEIYANELKNR